MWCSPLGECAHRSRRRPEERDCQAAPNRARSRPHNLALENFRTDQFRSPWYGCRACRTAPAEEMRVFVAAFFDTEPDQIADQDWIGVVIASDRIGRPLQWPRRRVVKGVDAAGIKVDV